MVREQSVFADNVFGLRENLISGERSSCLFFFPFFTCLKNRNGNLSHAFNDSLQIDTINLWIVFCHFKKQARTDVIDLYNIIFYFKKDSFQLSLQTLELLVSGLCKICFADLCDALSTHCFPVARLTERWGSWMFLFLLINWPLEARPPSQALLPAGVSSFPATPPPFPADGLHIFAGRAWKLHFVPAFWRGSCSRAALGAAQMLWYPKHPCHPSLEMQASSRIHLHRLWGWFSSSSGDSCSDRGDENQFLLRRWQAALSCRINPGW